MLMCKVSVLCDTLRWLESPAYTTEVQIQSQGSQCWVYGGIVELGHIFLRILPLPSVVYTIIRGIDKVPVRVLSYEAHSLAPPRG